LAILRFAHLFWAVSRPFARADTTLQSWNSSFEVSWRSFHVERWWKKQLSA
jgi:hypothetical protein